MNIIQYMIVIISILIILIIVLFIPLSDDTVNHNIIRSQQKNQKCICNSETKDETNESTELIKESTELIKESTELINFQ